MNSEGIKSVSVAFRWKQTVGGWKERDGGGGRVERERGIKRVELSGIPSGCPGDQTGYDYHENNTNLHETQSISVLESLNALFKILTLGTRC